MKKAPSTKWAIAATIVAIALTSASLQAQEHKIYPEKADAKAEIQQALDKANRKHKRVILDFGGNWCGDCKALDRYFHKEPNATLLKDNFILVDVNIGRYDMNLDIAAKYEVPLKRGVPALTVLGQDGLVLFTQKSGEFESMRKMDASSVTDFLNYWKG